MRKKSKRKQHHGVCSETDDQDVVECMKASPTRVARVTYADAVESQLVVKSKAQCGTIVDSSYLFEAQLSCIADLGYANNIEMDVEQQELVTPIMRITSSKSSFNTARKIKGIVHLAMVVFTWLSSSMLLSKEDPSATYTGFVGPQGDIERRLTNITNDPTKNLGEVEDPLHDYHKKLINIEKQEKSVKGIIAELERKRQQLTENDSSRNNLLKGDHRRDDGEKASSFNSRIDDFLGWLHRSSADKHRRDTRYATDGIHTSVFAWVFLVIVLLCCCTCQSLCGIMCICRHKMPQLELRQYYFFEDFQGVSFWEWCGWLDKEYSGIDASAYVGLLRREARLMLLMPLIPVACLPWTTCEEGTPDIAYYIYLPFAIRARAIETQVLIRLGAEWTAFVCMIMFSTFEHGDWFTDGTFPVQAYVCDDIMTPGLAHALHESSFPFLAGVILIVRFYGLAILLFSSSALSQQAVASGDMGNDMATLAADTAAFVAVAEHTDIPDVDGVSNRKLFTSGSKVFLENCFQLRVQSSGFALTFALTTCWAKMKALASLALGAGSATSKVCGVFIMGMKYIRTIERKDYDLRAAAIIFAMFLLLVVAPLGVVAWTAAQIYYAFICPSHLWNISSGCVPMP